MSDNYPSLSAAVSAAMEEATSPARRALDAAAAVAANAPARRGTYVSHAKIYWPLIEELRSALDELEVDWRPQTRRRVKLAGPNAGERAR